MTADRYALAHAAYERRMELGMTQEQVAERGGLATKAVWVWILQHAEGDDPLGTKLGKETEQ